MFSSEKRFGMFFPSLGGWYVVSVLTPATQTTIFLQPLSNCRLYCVTARSGESSSWSNKSEPISTTLIGAVEQMAPQNGIRKGTKLQRQHYLSEPHARGSHSGNWCAFWAICSCGTLISDHRLPGVLPMIWWMADGVCMKILLYLR